VAKYWVISISQGCHSVCLNLQMFFFFEGTKWFFFFVVINLHDSFWNFTSHVACCMLIDLVSSCSII